MMRHFLAMLCAALAIAPSVWAQSGGEADLSRPEGNAGWEQYYGMIADLEGIENGDAEGVYDMLSELAANKLDINRATRSDLERIVFLTDKQVDDILEYVARYGPVRSVAELMMVRSLDRVRCRLLSFFLYTGESTQKRSFPRLDSIFAHGRSELVAAANIPLYDRAGDRNGYLGYKYKHWIRYKYSYGRCFELGLTAAQDAGEPFFAGRNRWGYDFYSPYLMVRDAGWLRALAVGRYRLRMGMGLVMNTDFSFGKTAMLASTSRSSTSIRANSSRSEAKYLQGAAATVDISRHISLTAFASYRHVDATLNADSASVRTLLTTGYHRTESEMSRRRNTSQTAAGGSVALHTGPLRVSLQGVAATYSRRLQPDTSAVFRQWYPQGRTFTNASLAYSYTSHLVSLSGETATGSSGGWATLHSLTLAPSSGLAMMLIHRYYSYRYNSLFASAFSDRGEVKNEQGLYLGVDWRCSRCLSLAVYTDYAYSPWPRYMVTAASHSWDNMLSATLSLPSVTISARYRLRLRQRDNEDKTALVDRTEHRARLMATVARGAWTASLRADASAVAMSGTTDYGYMVSALGGYKASRVGIVASIGYFNTDSYNSRIYAYERSLLYSFAFPMFSGEGIRYALTARMSFTPRLMLMAKAATTDYFDRSVISSGLQQIDRSSQTDVALQVRWKF